MRKVFMRRANIMWDDVVQAACVIVFGMAVVVLVATAVFAS
jgi:hypothetical protein